MDDKWIALQGNHKVTICASLDNLQMMMLEVYRYEK